MRVAIVGAGVTGLSTAWLLQAHGVSVTLFEAGSQVGGLAGSFRAGDFAFDFGPHEFCTDNPALKTLLHDACGDDLLVVQKRTAQHFNQRYVRYPFEIVDVLKNVNPMLTLRALGEVAGARLRNVFVKPDDTSFENWTYTRFGKTLYQMYFGPYTKKVWGMDPSLLDPRTASQRITVDSVWDLIKKVVGYHWLGADDFKKTHSEFRRSFFYTRGGIGTLQHHLRQKVIANGGQLLTGRTLAGVSCGANGVERLHFTDGSVGEDFDYVVSTIPLPQLIGLVLGQRGVQLARTHELPFRAMAFVFLAINRPSVNDYHWIYYPDLDIPFQRLTEFTHFGAGMSPPGKTGVTLELSYTPGDSLSALPDSEIVARCVRRGQELGLWHDGDIEASHVVRVKHAYPLQVMQFLEKADALLTALAEVPNLVSIGRQGLFRYCNMNECVEMAIEVVPQILAGKRAIRYAKHGAWQGVGLTDRYAAASAATPSHQQPA